LEEENTVEDMEPREVLNVWDDVRSILGIGFLRAQSLHRIPVSRLQLQQTLPKEVEFLAQIEVLEMSFMVR
jgi:hypothetical protein